MITRKNAFVVGDTVYATLEDAQVAGLRAALSPAGQPPGDAAPFIEFCRDVVKNKDKVLDILTTTETSKPRARKINGGRKPRNVTKLTQPEMAAQ